MTVMVRKGLYSLILLWAFCSAAMAQEVVTRDSLSNIQPAEINPSTIDSPTFSPTGKNEPIVSNFHPEAALNAVEHHDIDPHALDISVKIPALPTWRGGGLYGSNGFHTDGLSMGYTADMMAVQQLGRFTLTGNAGLTKDFMPGWGYLNGASLGANLSYSVSNNVILSGFGGMSHTGFMGPAPNLTNYYYGGAVTLLTNNHKWGMDVGVRRYYNPATGTWTTVPIAMPYYNWNGQKIGFDLGPLLLNAFQGLDKALNPHHYKQPSPEMMNGRLPGGGIIGPDIDTTPHFGAPEEPYQKRGL